MGERRAIVIGVDGYSFRPLASAVNDAVAIRDALVSRSTPALEPIVAESDVTLLATPGTGRAAPSGSVPATRDAILSALKSHYDDPNPAEFLLVFFAGHGVVASPDGRVRETLVLPSDVTGSEDGRNMISLTELIKLFAERGPLQQVWIVDACRDMPYERRPRGYSIEWQPQPHQGSRAQVAIFAVAEGGTALSVAGGQGRFSGHLIGGLAGTGSAADHIPGRGHCVTAESLHEYARRRVAEALEGYDDWTRAVQMPQIAHSSTALDPLRTLPPPSPRRFAVTVRPPEAETAVSLALEVELGLPVAGWPPMAPPRVYELRATLQSGMELLGWGQPQPPLVAVDLREEDAVVIDVPRRASQPKPLPALLPGERSAVIVAAGPLGGDPLEAALKPQPEEPVRSMPPTTGERGIARARTWKRESAPVSSELHSSDPSAILTVVATDAVARVRLRRAESPWDERDEARNTPIHIEPGVWDVMVMLGDETISATRIVLDNGEMRTVAAVAQITPATAALLPPEPPRDPNVAAPTIVMPSESIGAMQGAILPTLLPLLALKLYDTKGIILSRLGHLAIPVLPDSGEVPEGEVPLIVAVAVEGTRTSEQLLTSADGRLQRHGVDDARMVWVGADNRVALFAGWKRESRDTVTIEVGGRRTNVAAPAMRDGVTVVTATSWPDGRLDFSIGIFRLPVGSLWDPKAPDVPVGRIARALAFAAPLFRAGASLEQVPDPVLNEIAHAKWLDPVLGALAFHARDHRLSTEAQSLDAQYAEHLWNMRETIRRNLRDHFGDLPDSRIIAALDVDAAARRTALRALLEAGDLGQPVLTASLAHLARAAVEAGLQDHWSVERLDRIVPGQVFNAVRMPTGGRSDAFPR